MKKIAHVSISYRYYRKKVNFPVKYYVAKRFKDSANKMKKKKKLSQIAINCDLLSIGATSHLDGELRKL